MNQPIDHGNRLAALNPLRSVCVTAPAGSGKTELLTQRVLKLLARVEKPEAILAITFTRKAAAEMHHRIIEALRDAEHSPEPQEAHKKLSWQLARDALARDREAGWQLLHNSGRLKVQTIDSLCASLTRQMPILANFGAQPVIGDDPQALYRSAVRSLLAQLENNTAISRDIAVLLDHFDNRLSKVENLLVSLLSNRDQWLLQMGFANDPEQSKRQLLASLQLITEDTLRAVHQTLLPFRDELVPLMDYAGCNMQWQGSDSAIGRLAGATELPGLGGESLPDWRALTELLLVKNNDWRKSSRSFSKTVGFPTETHDGDKTLAKQLKQNIVDLLETLKSQPDLLDQLVALRFCPGVVYGEQQWQLLQALTRILPELLAHLLLEFQSRGEVDYSQISMAALQALGDGLSPTELAMKLDYRLSHILVDEFQDTSTSQFRLLERLTEGWAEYNQNNPEQPNTLFIVGDGMQSIYAFREANVGLFLEARRQGINGIALEDLPLQVNFRSTPTVVNWANAVFAESFPAKENIARGAVSFEPAAAFNSDKDHSCVKVLGFSGEQARALEAEATLKLVQQSLALNPDGSVAVLVRNRSHLKEIIASFSRAGLSWNAADIDPLTHYQLIQDLLSLTRALLNPADDISWAALLRAPWIGLDNRDLFYLLGERGPLSVSEQIMATYEHAQIKALSQSAVLRLSRAAQVFSTALTERQRLSPRDWVEGVWIALGGPEAVADPLELSLAEDFFLALEQAQEGQQLPSLAVFEQNLQHLYASSADATSPIHIMTIHKAKGLEFDTVILPAVARQPRSDDKPLLMWRKYLSPRQPQRSGLLLSTPEAIGGEEDAVYKYLRYEKSTSAKLETTRLFYVAATRAVSRLFILLTGDKDTRSDEYRPPAAASLLSACWPSLCDSVEWLEGQAVASDADKQQAALQTLRRLPDHYFAAQTSEPLALVDQDESNTPELLADPLPTAVGTVVHQIFEALVLNGVELWAERDAAQRRRWLEALLHQQQLPVLMNDRACELITQAVENTLADQTGQRLLAGDHRQSRAELSLSAVDAKRVRERILDRVFYDQEGALWIVDYKTGMPLEGESREAFIARELASYGPQLQNYSALIAGLPENHPLGGSQKIKIALYFTYYPHLQEVQP